MEQFAREGRPRRREYSRNFKAQILAQCDQPGASVGGVALSNGLHANMVHRWIREERLRGESRDLVRPSASPAFVAVPLPAPEVVSVNEQPPAREVKLRFQRSELVASVQCTVTECAALLREVLR